MSVQQLERKLEPDRESPRLDERFTTNIQGKDFVLYAGLLDLAHQIGIKSIYVEPEQFPNKENGQEAICKAVVESAAGKLFTEWGDANPNNVNKKIVGHLLRMAATRAKGRALRDMTNIGMTCLEELGNYDEVISDNKEESGKVTRMKKSGNNNGNGAKPSQKKEEVAQEAGEKKPPAEPIPLKKPENNNAPSIAQLKAIENLAKRRGITSQSLEQMAIELFGVKYQHISPTEAASFIRNLQQSA